jgi:hypothetical protein
MDFLKKLMGMLGLGGGDDSAQEPQVSMDPADDDGLADMVQADASEAATEDGLVSEDEM